MDQRTARRQPAPRLRTNLDTDFLKLIAILSMLLDHIGAVFFPEHPAFRWVGRLAFPIFCYCMTVGLLYTRDIKRYLGRLGLFALISQPCYILATHPWDWQTEWMNWNIFFTLFLSLLAMWGFRTLDFFGKMPKALTDEDINYSTVALSNLGSIRCPAVYHHLNNYGNNSIMVTIGTIHKEEVFQPDGSRAVRDIVDVGVTLDERIADGFYFTIGYPGMTSGELAKELMYYGVSAISLVTTGSHQEGLRACTSFIKDHQYAQLDERMKLFAQHHPVA